MAGGGICKGSVVFCLWKGVQKRLHNNVLELLTVYHTLKHFLPSLEFSHTSQNRENGHNGPYKPSGGTAPDTNVSVGSENSVIGSGALTFASSCSSAFCVLGCGSPLQSANCHRLACTPPSGCNSFGVVSGQRMWIVHIGRQLSLPALELNYEGQPPVRDRCVSLSVASDAVICLSTSCTSPGQCWTKFAKKLPHTGRVRHGLRT